MNLRLFNLMFFSCFFILSSNFIFFLQEGECMEIMTDEYAPYDMEEANWRIGNYLQCIVNGNNSLISLSENFIGKGVIPDERMPILTYVCDTGRLLLCLSEEAMFTPVVRLEMIKKCFQGIYNARYPGSTSLFFVWDYTERQTTYLRPCAKITDKYPASRLIALNLPDTGPEKLATIGFRINVAGKAYNVSGRWYDESNYNYEDLKDNEHNDTDHSYTTIRNYTSDVLPPVTIKGIGWDGQADNPLEINLVSPANETRQGVQLVISNFTDEQMGFSAPYPCKMPEIVQLPDKSEITSKQWYVLKPSYQYIIIYTKDAQNTGFEYQNAMVFAWEKTPAKVMVEWSGGKYGTVAIEYSNPGDINKKVWIARFQGVDPSSDLNHIHTIANNIITKQKIGMNGYMPYESCWMEEPVAGMCAGAYIICKYDKDENKFGGAYADKAKEIATKLMDDRIDMWNRGRKCSNTYEYVTGAYFLTLLYDLPGRFNDKVKKDYYMNWVKEFCNNMIMNSQTGGRVMQAVWRAYELTGDEEYRSYYESIREQYTVSEDKGIVYKGSALNPRDFYGNMDALGGFGRRGLPEDKKDIDTAIKFLTKVHRWIDTGYLGWWWEVTGDANICGWGKWSKALGMEKANKKIISVSEFPIYYKKGNNVVVDISSVPTIYNPNYWDKEVMNNYLPLLPHKIAKSIIFRIENILVKTDYPNDFWVGTKDQSVIDVLNSIKNKIQIILKYIDDGTVKTANYENTTKLLSECFSLWDSMELKAKQPKGNANDIQGELFYAKSNLEYLRNVLK